MNRRAFITLLGGAVAARCVLFEAKAPQPTSDVYDGAPNVGPAYLI
jgi:hypothetical protein